jgi:pyruvate/2-oxoglutarate dehydrogenase complex dihydrolipoamide acyltransferase (E2) component
MLIEIKVPSVGESVTEALLAQWFKNDGDPVKKDEPLFVIETDKVTLEVVAEDDGILMIKVPEGETIAIGAVVGTLDTAATTPEAAPQAAAAAKSVKSTPPEPPPEAEPQAPVAADSQPQTLEPPAPPELPGGPIQYDRPLAPSVRWSALWIRRRTRPRLCPKPDQQNRHHPKRQNQRRLSQCPTLNPRHLSLQIRHGRYPPDRLRHPEIGLRRISR